jgi:translation initiation factor 1A
MNCLGTNRPYASFFRKRTLAQNPLVLKVGLRDYQDCKADVILKYSADEARNLKSYGEFPETVKINETVTFGEEGFDDDIEFDDVDSSEEEGDGLGTGIDDI